MPPYWFDSAGLSRLFRQRGVLRQRTRSGAWRPGGVGGAAGPGYTDLAEWPWTRNIARAMAAGSCNMPVLGRASNSRPEPRPPRSSLQAQVITNHAALST